MATPSTSSKAKAETGGEEDTSYTSMHELEAIGAHCTFCRQKDFLPFRCESCKQQFCRDHRTEDAHYCTKKGAYLAERLARQQRESESIGKTQKPNIYSHKQCSEPTCKDLIDVIGKPAVYCDKCKYRYCWKHRMPEDHDCETITKRQASAVSQQRDKGLAALAKLRAWGASKKVEIAKDTKAKSIAIQTKVSSSSANDARLKRQQTNELKQTAKGDAKIAPEDRIYVFLVNAVPRPSPSPSPSPSPMPGATSSTPSQRKFATARAFYSSKFNGGRVLDMVAKELKVENKNNRVSDNEKLRIWHQAHSSKSGKILSFDMKETLAAQGVQTGDALVLIRGYTPPPMEEVKQTLGWQT